MQKQSRTMQSAAKQSDHDSTLFQGRMQPSAAVLVGASPSRMSPMTISCLLVFGLTLALTGINVHKPNMLGSEIQVVLHLRHTLKGHSLA